MNSTQKNIKTERSKLWLVMVVFLFLGKSIAAQMASHKAVIDAEEEILTVINVILPQKGQQEEIVQKLQNGISKVMRYQTGFISANIHKSLDSDHIVVYAQWKDSESLQKAVELINAGGAPDMMYVFSKAVPDYHPYEVISVNLAAQSE